MKTDRLASAVVTGASSGIGRAIAIALAPRVRELHLIGRSVARLEEVRAAAAAEGASPHVHALDLADDAALRTFPERLGVLESGIAALVHGAGDVALGTVESADVADLDRQFRMNVRVPFLLTQRLLPHLRRARGQIVFVNSGAGLHARPGWSQYAITKHGLRALADSLREEVSADGVRVTSVYPGRTATPMQEAVHRMEGREFRPERFLRPEDVAAQIAAAMLLPESASVTDLSIRPTGA